MITATAASAALAFVLGLRHALDADHLAAVDGLTRWNVGAGRTFAPFCGALFAVGHSTVILVASILFTFMTGQLDAPAWLAPMGAFSRTARVSPDTYRLSTETLHHATPDDLDRR